MCVSDQLIINYSVASVGAVTVANNCLVTQR